MVSDDIRVGYICYSVLAGIILRDLFPEPEIVCKTLKTEQRGAVILDPGVDHEESGWSGIASVC